MADLAALKDLLSYDPETGKFHWRKRHGKMAAGSLAGAADRYGYISIGVMGKRHAAHRLAWLLTYGTPPRGQIDHINLDKADNRIANLRLADNSTNQMNVAGRGHYRKGATRHAEGKYQAQIKHNNKNFYLGLFNTEEEAAAAYRGAAKILFGEFARFE